MSKKNRKPQRPRLNAFQVLVQKKAKSLVAAEKSYWETISSLRKQRHSAAESLALPYETSLPESISSTVWGLSDGVAFVRHKTVGDTARVDFRALPHITLEEWGKSGLIVPLEKGDFSLAQAGAVGGLGNISMINCQVNDVHIPYVEFAYLRYGDSSNAPSVEKAVLDFQLTILGLQTQQPSQQGQPISSRHTVDVLKEIAFAFEKLLDDKTKEEELQVFLKNHSFILHPSAESIPKKKLGEDFVTDFVLVATTMQGPTYILVELERASHPLLTKELTLSSPVSHAIKQTRDWDVWLEKNKAYLQSKLPGFETPSFMVVIGRGHQLSEEEKAYLRSYNRDWKSTSLLTYDDVLSRFRNTIANLESLTQSAAEKKA